MTQAKRAFSDAERADLESFFYPRETAEPFFAWLDRADDDPLRAHLDVLLLTKEGRESLSATWSQRRSNAERAKGRASSFHYLWVAGVEGTVSADEQMGVSKEDRKKALDFVKENTRLPVIFIYENGVVVETHIGVSADERFRLFLWGRVARGDVRGYQYAYTRGELARLEAKKRREEKVRRKEAPERRVTQKDWLEHIAVLRADNEKELGLAKEALDRAAEERAQLEADLRSATDKQREAREWIASIKARRMPCFPEFAQSFAVGGENE